MHRDVFTLKDLLRAVTARTRMQMPMWHWDDPSEWVHSRCCSDKLGEVILVHEAGHKDR